MSASCDQRLRSPGLLRELRLRDATSIVAGTIIGSGIFLVPGNIANQLSSFAAVILVWLTGGLLSLFGALALGELGAAFPKAGGLYVYLRQAYGRTTGFLYGWALLALIHSGSIATLAVAFRLYLAQIIPLTSMQQKAAGILLVLVLTGVHCLGVKSGKNVHNALTVAKYAGIAVMLGLLFYGAHSHLLRTSVWPRDGFHFRPGAFGIALIAVLWAYEGWHVLSFMTGEFTNSRRDLPRGLFYGTLIVAITYLIANVAYYSVLTSTQIQHTQRVAATAVNAVTGGAGAAAFISLLILVSIIGATNGMILTGPRVYYAMAKEGLFFSVFGKVNSRSGLCDSCARIVVSRIDLIGIFPGVVHVCRICGMDFLWIDGCRRHCVAHPTPGTGTAVSRAWVSVAANPVRNCIFGNHYECHCCIAHARALWCFIGFQRPAAVCAVRSARQIRT